MENKVVAGGEIGLFRRAEKGKRASSTSVLQRR
jgi:hypothetical protein